MQRGRLRKSLARGIGFYHGATAGPTSILRAADIGSAAAMKAGAVSPIRHRLLPQLNVQNREKRTLTKAPCRRKLTTTGGEWYVRQDTLVQAAEKEILEMKEAGNFPLLRLSIGGVVGWAFL